MLKNIYVVDVFFHKIGFKATAYAEVLTWAGAILVNIDDLRSKYEVEDTYAYVGLQMRQDGPKAIMAFGEINYKDAYGNETRTFEYRNIRVRKYKKKNWTTIKTSRVYVDTAGDNKKGKAVCGATADRFYGIASGYGPGAFDIDEFVGDTYTIKPIKNLDIPSTKGKKVTLKGIKRSKVKKYKKWIRQANKKVKVTVK